MCYFCQLFHGLPGLAFLKFRSYYYSNHYTFLSLTSSLSLVNIFFFMPFILLTIFLFPICFEINVDQNLDKHCYSCSHLGTQWVFLENYNTSQRDIKKLTDNDTLEVKNRRDRFSRICIREKYQRRVWYKQSQQSKESTSLWTGPKTVCARFSSRVWIRPID